MIHGDRDDSDESRGAVMLLVHVSYFGRVTRKRRPAHPGSHDEYMGFFSFWGVSNLGCYGSRLA